MAKLKIEGVVQHIDLKPVSGANVEIIDMDQGGNGHDVILQVITNAEGRFKGETPDWNDENNIVAPWRVASSRNVT